MRTPRRIVSLLTLGLVGALTVTACQAIPIDGPVQPGLTDFSQAEQPVHFDPDGPIEGASQEEIVRGFVRAATSTDDDYAVARQFLTPEYVSQWSPSAGVLIEEGGQSFSVDEEGVATLEVSSAAVVDEHGAFSLASAASPTELRFELEEVRGEWRISSAPNGVVLDRAAFTTLWLPMQLYFLTPDNRLVSETRWFLNRPTLSTRIVSELLGGPAAEMDASLRTAFPDGTALTSSSVPVSDSVARIDLTDELLNAAPEEVLLMKRQIATSLYAVPGVSRFEISVNGVLLEQGAVTPADDGSVIGERPGPVLLADAELDDLPVTNLAAVEGLGQRIVELAPTAVTLAYDHQTAAVLHASGLSWVSIDDSVQIDVREGLREPIVDRFGYVWSYATSAPSEVLVALPGRSQDVLPMPWLDGRTPVAIRISKNGVRAAVLLAEGENSVVILAEVVRDRLGEPIGLGAEPNRQMWVTGAPKDIDWLDDRRFAVLTRSGSSGRITVGSPGNFAYDAGTVADAVKVSAGSDTLGSLRVLTSGGALYAQQGSGWQRQLDGVALLAKSG